MFKKKQPFMPMIKRIFFEENSISQIKEEGHIINNLKNGKFKSICFFRPFDYYTYSFKLQQSNTLNEIPNRVSFLIEEKQKSTILMYPKHKTTHSVIMPNLHAEVASRRTLVACSTIYYSDFKYNIECPVWELPFIMYIKGSYIPPSGNYKCRHPDVWTLKTINSSKVLSTSSLNSLKFDSVNIFNLSKCPIGEYLDYPGAWIKIANVWHFGNTNCYFTLHIGKLEKKCFMNKKVIMIGDSHMQYRAKALRKQRLSLKSTWSTVSYELAYVVNKSVLDAGHNASVILVLNSGHWDFAYLDLAAYISGMIKVFKVIRFTRLFFPNLRLIWIETTAFPEMQEYNSLRSNTVIAAMNDWVNHFMEKNGIPVVPAFEISFPMRSKTIDGSHYFTLFGQDAQRNPKNISVDGAISSVLISHICS